MNIIDRYGIKEVANLTLYEIDEDGNLKSPALVLDTLQISNIEYSTEETIHYGGVGNAPIISWEHNRTVELQAVDALFSMKSLAVFCGGKLDKNHEDKITKTEMFKATATTVPIEGQSSSGWESYFSTISNKKVLKKDPHFYNAYQTEVKSFEVGETYFCTYLLDVDSISIEISEGSFPNYYCVIGETYIRSEITGQDEPFFFIMPKAKPVTNLVIDLSSSDDPTTFDLTFKAVQFKDLNLIELIKCGEFGSQSLEDDTLAILGKAILGKLILGQKEEI